MINKEMHEKFSAKLSGICRENLGIEFADVNAAIDREEFKEKWIFVDRAHLTDFGNRVVADHLHRVIMT